MKMGHHNPWKRGSVCWVNSFNMVHENTEILTGVTFMYKGGKWATGK